MSSVGFSGSAGEASEKRRRPSREEILRTIADVAWPILRPYVKIDCCIAATRIAIDVLSRYGITARPQPTVAIAGNARFRAWVERRLEDPNVPPPPDVRFVTIDTEASTDRAYAGHLLAVGRVAGEPFLLDLSAPQFNRPEKGIVIPGSVLITNVDPEAGLPSMDLPDGGLLFYEQHPNPEDASWMKSRDWRLVGPRREFYGAIADDIVSAVDNRLGIERDR